MKDRMLRILRHPTFSGAVMSMAVFATALIANTSCWWFDYQDEVPEEANQFRKF